MEKRKNAKNKTYAKNLKNWKNQKKKWKKEKKMQKNGHKKMMFTQYTSDGMKTKISHNPDILDSCIDLKCQNYVNLPK